MEDSFEEQLNSMSDSNKSTGRLAAWTSSSTDTHISSSSYPDATTSAAYEYDELVEIKEEIIDDKERLQGGEYNLLSKNYQLAEKYLSSSNKSAPESSMVYKNGETLEIKEEIIEDQERHEGGEFNLLSENNQLAENYLPSGSKSVPKTSVVYENDESLEIKEEIIQETVSGPKIEKKYESTLNTVDTTEADIWAANNLRTHKENKIKEPKREPDRKYKCQNCARNYKHLQSLNTHQKFECGIPPRFICKFCDKRFKRKNGMSRHVVQMHQKTNLNQNKPKVEESKQELEQNLNIPRQQNTSSHISQASNNCDECSLNYSSLRALRRHNRLKHAADKPEFTCDVCSYKTNAKSGLSRHISARHFKNSKTSQELHNCYKCSLNYSSLDALRRHNRFKHAAHKPEFTCDVCDYKTNIKSNLSKHISSRHFKDPLLARHNCDKCSRIYSSLSGLYKHNRLKHAANKPEFTCDVCDYKTDVKYTLSSHISSRHLK